MVTDYRINQIVNYDLLSFLNDIGCTRMQFKLLCFWGRHPKAKLSLYTIAKALDVSGVNLRDSITALVVKGILTTQHSNNGLTTYALSDEETQEFIGELAKLDWSKTMNLGKQLKQESA